MAFSNPTSPDASASVEDPMNDAFGRPQSAVVLGGTSEIAGALVNLLVADRCQRVVLAGRDADALRGAAQRARVGGAAVVETVTFDASELGEVEAVSLE